jgi:hypothetical protein
MRASFLKGSARRDTLAVAWFSQASRRQRVGEGAFQSVDDGLPGPSNRDFDQRQGTSISWVDPRWWPVYKRLLSRDD